jgi:hypothetical protein
LRAVSPSTADANSSSLASSSAQHLEVLSDARAGSKHVTSHSIADSKIVS